MVRENVAGLINISDHRMEKAEGLSAAETVRCPTAERGQSTYTLGVSAKWLENEKQLLERTAKNQWKMKDKCFRKLSFVCEGLTTTFYTDDKHVYASNTYVTLVLS